MFIVNIAIRWANGDLEGFGGSGLTEESARVRAITKARQKALDMHIVGNFVQLTPSQYKALSIEEQDSLQADWDGESL